MPTEPPRGQFAYDNNVATTTNGSSNNLITDDHHHQQQLNQNSITTTTATTARPPPPSTSPPISLPEVPEIFMLEQFDLSKLETFNTVIASTLGNIHSTGTSHPSQMITKHVHRHDDRDHYWSTKTMLTTLQLSELQLSFTDYLDAIEDKLSRSISNRSGDFSQVMSSVDSVMDELSLAIKSVTSLRRKCALLNESLRPNLNIINLSNRRNNEQITLAKLTEIAQLSRVPPKIQLLLSSSDFVGALDLVAKSRFMLHKDYKRVNCLKHLESHLLEGERMAGTMIQREFECRLKESNFDKLLATEFNNLSKLVENFSSGVSDIPDRNSLNLKSLLQTQREKFVNKFHDERMKKVELSLDNEQWKMVERIPHDFQRMVTMLVDENKSVSEYLLTEELQSAPNYTMQPRGSLIDPSSLEAPLRLSNIPSDSKVGMSNQIVAGGTTFVLVESVINMIRIVMDYCKCAQEIRPLSDALMEKLFSVLNNYNHKTYHLVHEAGATRQESGLKCITSRTFVLAQRSLKLMILLMPSIHQHFGKLLPGDKRLRQFDEIKFNYERHAAQVPVRIDGLAKEAIDSDLTHWKLRPPIPTQQFKDIVMHLTRLHDNIQDVLPANDLRMLFLKINNTFKETLLAHLIRLNFKNEAGPQQHNLKTELLLYKNSLANLTVFRGIDMNYDDIWSRLEKRTSDLDKEVG